MNKRQSVNAILSKLPKEDSDQVRSYLNKVDHEKSSLGGRVGRLEQQLREQDRTITSLRKEVSLLKSKGD